MISNGVVGMRAGNGNLVNSHAQIQGGGDYNPFPFLAYLIELPARDHNVIPRSMDPQESTLGFISSAFIRDKLVAVPSSSSNFPRTRTSTGRKYDFCGLPRCFVVSTSSPSQTPRPTTAASLGSCLPGTARTFEISRLMARLGSSLGQRAFGSASSLRRKKTLSRPRLLDFPWSLVAKAPASRIVQTSTLNTGMRASESARIAAHLMSPSIGLDRYAGGFSFKVISMMETLAPVALQKTTTPFKARFFAQYTK
jgi:hypothetical protein